jgi:hypothetical protein
VNCQELLDLLLEYTSGELVVEQHRSFELHLIGCDKCLMLVESYRYTIRLAGALPKAEPLPASVEDRLRKRLSPLLHREDDKKD